MSKLRVSQPSCTNIIDVDDTLKKLKRSEHLQRDLLFCLILSLVFFLAARFLVSDIRGLYINRLGFNDSHWLLSGLLVVSILLISYIVLKDRSVRLLKNTLIKQKDVLENEEDKLEALYAVGMLLSSNIEKQVIFNVICSGLVKCLKGDQSSLMLYDKQNQVLQCISCFGLKSDLILGQQVKMGEGIAGWVAMHRTPLLLDKDIKEYKFLNLVEKERDIISSICVPLALGSNIKGVLSVNLINKENRKFDEHDLRIAKIFAQNAVLAVERAQVFETAEKLEQHRPATA
ncbi:MAG: hypothetical protein A2145_01580 [candidate division Zixibacteria bacterium RBG_16_40_9]|nr:MAG: hypothetical protein A2145_01580 [candidate division Zixibacteria bacterium RBG_16_40_9]